MLTFLVNQKNNEGFRVVYVLRKCVKTFTLEESKNLFFFLTGSGFLRRLCISLRTQRVCEEQLRENGREPGRTYFADKFAVLDFTEETFS